MTIEEYLNKRIEKAEKHCREKHPDAYETGYWDGYYDAMDDLLRELPLLDHEVTLKELHQYCDKHRKKEEGHHGCPFLIEGNPNAEEFKDRFPGCGFTRRYPCGWKPDVIQKLMKEAGNE